MHIYIHMHIYIYASIYTYIYTLIKGLSTGLHTFKIGKINKILYIFINFLYHQTWCYAFSQIILGLLKYCKGFIIK